MEFAGFGSLLRAMGNKRSGEETDNIDACRDLSGRRLRHVEGEKKCVPNPRFQLTDVLPL